MREITREELVAAFRSLMNGKASGKDGMQNEAWINATKNLLNQLQNKFARTDAKTDEQSVERNDITKEMERRYYIMKPKPKGGT